MKTNLAVASAAGLLVAAVLASGARAQQPSPPLTADEAAILRLIVGCRTDSTPTYCAPFRDLLSHLAQSPAPAAAPTPAPAAAAAAMPAVPPAPSTASALDFARGHAPGDIQVIPEAGKPVLAVTAATDTKTASLALTIDGSGGNGGAPRLWTLTAQTPIDDEKDHTTLATQDGMSKASSIGLQYTRFWVRMGDNSALINDPKYNARCVAVLRKFSDAAPNAQIPQSLFLPSGCHGGRVLGLIQAQASLPAETRKALAAEAQGLADELNKGLIKSVWMFSGGAKAGYEKHAFYDPLTLAKTKVDRTPFEVSADATYVFHGGDTSASLGYKFQRVYKDGGEDEETRTVCLPGGTPLLTCANGFIGRPLRDKQHLITAQVRHITDKGLFGLPTGFNPTVTYDAQSGEYGVQLPVYLLDNKSKGLTGGVRYDWLSKDHDSTFGIFIGSSFCVLPGYSGCSPKDDD